MKLVLITREYPFGNNENFLESEIPILATYFKEILIYPQRKATTLRETPSNVYVSEAFIAAGKNNYVTALKALSNRYTYSVLFGSIRLLKSRRSLIAILKHIFTRTVSREFAKYLLEKDDLRVIYSYWYTTIVDELVIQKEAHISVVCRVHRGDLYEEMTDLKHFPGRSRTIKKITKIYSISDDGCEYLQRRFDLKNVEVSRLGVSNPNELNSGNTDGSTITIVSVSNIIPVKRVDLIAESIVGLALRFTDKKIIWHHFGDGHDRDLVVTTLNHRNLENFDYHLHGRVKNSLIYDFYKKNDVDVFINLSVSEGIPVSIMEAQSFGIPVVATSVGGVSEIVDSTNGKLLTAHPSVQETIQAIQEVIDRRYDRSIIRSHWTKKYDAKVNFSNFSKDLISLF